MTLGVVCVAQNYIIEDSIIIIKKSGNYNLFWSSSNGETKITKEEKYITLQDLLEYYSDYELECYNDSTLFKGYIEIIDTTYNSMWYDYQTFYTHKEPTFKGFIEYLKTK